MINVGIAGSYAGISRHKSALSQLSEIRIAGTWSVGSSETISDLSTGLVLTGFEKILDKIDVLIITDAGKIYNQLAISALRKARHVFLYPSVLSSTNEVYALIKLAREANVILKCGKTGKLSLKNLLNHISNPSEIGIIEYQHVFMMNNAEKISPLPDILLADMEIILRLIRARNTSIKAKGLSMISGKADVINARMEFDNGSAVNYYCNTLGTHCEHAITILLNNSILKYNILKNELSGWYLKNHQGNPVFIESLKMEQPDYLVDDLLSFFNLIQSGSAFLSIYDNGLESFILTERVLEKVMKTLVQYA